MFSEFKNLTQNGIVKKIRKLRNLTEQELADMLNISLESYLQLENNEKIKTQMILDIAHILNVCPQIICYQKCFQDNPLCLKQNNYICPYLCSNKLESIGEISPDKLNLLIKLDNLNKTDRNTVFNIVDALYLKELRKYNI